MVITMDKTILLSSLKSDCEFVYKSWAHSNGEALIFGHGNPDSNIVFVGEAPGKKEVSLNTPFVGKAGENLDFYLEILGKNRKDIYITNVVKFRPVKEKIIASGKSSFSNRPPSKEEIDFFKLWLYKEINILEPDILVCLGQTALSAFSYDEKILVGQTHGCVVEIKKDIFTKDMILFSLFHPASIIYNRKLRPIYEEDVRKLREILEN